MIKLSGGEAAILRLSNQFICGSRLDDAGELVRRMACVQAQDFSMAKWALGCRLASATDRSIETAFRSGAVLRTHVLRPTWHFVHPEDLRWMLALSAPKIKALSAPYLRKLGIDRAALRKSRRVILRELTGRPRVTREDLTLALERENLAVGENRIGFLLMDAELDGIICSAGRDGKKFTYQLLDNAVPPSALRDRKECIGELARRYFTTRGPSGLADFAWWAGLTMAEAREGAQSNGKLLEQAKVGDKLYWFVAGMPECLTDGKSEALKKGTFFLPAFDEYAVAYKDRSLVLDPLLAQQCRSGLSPVIVHMGKIIGTWRRKTAKESGSGGLLETSLFTPIQATRQFKAASERYSAFAFPNGNA